ncbi:hypothetical protein GX48_02591, partial [Paracoccidioides brasiliensis]
MAKARSRYEVEKSGGESEDRGKGVFTISGSKPRRTGFVP